MFAALRSTWAMFLGLGLIMTASGLQATLLGVRAGREGFATEVTGLIMSGYFAGFLVGSVAVPRLVAQVGHVRVFAALASLLSTAVLVHAVLVEPATWFLMRLLTGFASAGLYIVAESWLNDRSPNESRGQVLSLYMIVVLGSLGIGQLLMNLADPDGYVLFIGASILLSLALVPLLLTAGAAPDFTAPKRLGLRALYRISPLGVIACFGIGLLQSMLWGLSAVYAEGAGFSIAQISLYVGAIFLGGIVLQWPVGRLSDRYDRRSVMTGVLLSLALLAAPAALLGPLTFHSEVWAIGLIGGLGMTCYSVAIAYVNDWLEPEQMVAASAGLYFVYGIGATLGPFGASWVMAEIGPEGYYLSMATVAGVTALFALYRMTRRHALPIGEQGPSVALAAPATPLTTEMAAEFLVEEAEEAEEAGTVESGT